MTTVCGLLLFSACYYDKADKLYPYASQCDTSNMRYGANIMPMIQTNCLNKGCHTTANPSGGYNLESYSGLTVVISGNKLANAVGYLSGGSKNMPPDGKLSDCDINRIKALINKGYPQN